MRCLLLLLSFCFCCLPVLWPGFLHVCGVEPSTSYLFHLTWLVGLSILLSRIIFLQVRHSNCLSNTCSNSTAFLPTHTRSSEFPARFFFTSVSMSFVCLNLIRLQRFVFPVLSLIVLQALLYFYLYSVVDTV